MSMFKHYDDTLPQNEGTNVNIPIPNIVIPKFDDLTHTYFPFIRFDLSNRWTYYELFKTAINTVLLVPLRIVVLIVLLVPGTFFYQLTIFNLYKNDSLEQKSNEYTTFNKFFLNVARIMCKAFLTCFGILHVKKKKLTYKDLIKYGYKLPKKYENYYKNNTEPESHIIVANHLGYADILILLAHYKGSFLSKESVKKLPFIGKIACSVQTMFLKNDIPLGDALIERCKYTYDSHRNKKCTGCALCQNKLCIFPEGTTTNGKALLKFRTGVFNAKQMVKPLLIKFPHENWSLSWETYHFRSHLFRTMTQFINYVEVIELPPYIPNENEINDPVLYSCNVEYLMANILNIPVYYINRKSKLKGYHVKLKQNLTDKKGLQLGKQYHEKDSLFQALNIVKKTTTSKDKDDKKRTTDVDLSFLLDKKYEFTPQAMIDDDN